MNKKAAGACGEDRISDLPDGVLHHVLSLLPVQQAVQTSVLARRWRHLWKGVPALRLVGPKTRFATAQDFHRFVNRLIAVRGHLPLVSCEVEACLTWDDYAGEPEEPSRTCTSTRGSSTRWRARFRCSKSSATLLAVNQSSSCLLSPSTW
ncbi:F-box/LRR-repeat protein At3g59190-like [Miscanthus floridulus]|uniref:F-box/LRR-repeat protein At3g59190-like n=1 Tax=Miscanthus floridulus TaxID=154761 RepID=UPI00345AA85B